MLLPWTTSPSPERPAARGESELARRRDVRAEALVAKQPEHGDVRERLGAVEDAPALADRLRQRARLRADRLLAVHDERRSEPLGEVRGRNPAEREHAVLHARGVGEEIEHRWILPGTVFGSCGSFFHSPGTERGAAAAIPPGLSHERLFCVPRRMSEAMDQYDAKAIEPKWQRVWEDAEASRVSNEERPPKSYVLEMLPYPSGTLHVGHMLVYTIGDVVTRFRSRNGMHVLHPQGFDSFGLPAENAAIKEGVHPRESTERNIEHITRSMKRAGWAYDWSRSLTTHDPAYYRWQQWQFLRFLERGLAYRKGAPVKWCPNDQTVLANEQVLANGTCERCGAEVESRLMEQWFFRITDYAQALLDDLETVDWPESIKSRQRNWIGRSEGAEIVFRIAEWDEDISVFTTRPDTLYGATFFVLAPEHELVQRIDSDEVRAYVRRAGGEEDGGARRRRSRRQASPPACTPSTR